MNMKKLLLIILLIIFCSSSGWASANRLRNHDHGDRLPTFTLPLLKGGAKQTFRPGNGRPAAVMFFSITPEFRNKRSLALLAALNALQGEFHGKVDFIAVYSDDQKISTVVQFMKESNISLPVYHDARDEVNNLYGIFMMPLVVLIDKHGALHEVIPYTYNIREMVEGNLRLLLDEWDVRKLKEFLTPKDVKPRSKEEKEYIRRVNYGKVMVSRKMYAQAIREFTTATKLMPDLVDAWIELGFAQLAVEDWIQAERNFRRALKIDSESDDAIAGLGLAIYGRGDIDAALPELENAFIAPEPRLEVIIALAEIYEKKGDIKKAIRLNKLAVARLMTMYEHHWQ